MSAAPRFKVFDRQGVYQAACKEIEAAAALVAFYGEGATIKEGHRGVVLWKEGSEAKPAAESYDEVAATAFARMREAEAKSYARHVLRMTAQATARGAA